MGTMGNDASVLSTVPRAAKHSSQFDAAANIDAIEPVGIANMTVNMPRIMASSTTAESARYTANGTMTWRIKMNGYRRSSPKNSRGRMLDTITPTISMVSGAVMLPIIWMEPCTAPGSCTPVAAKTSAKSAANVMGLAAAFTPAATRCRGVCAAAPPAPAANGTPMLKNSKLIAIMNTLQNMVTSSPKMAAATGIPTNGVSCTCS